MEYDCSRISYKQTGAFSKLATDYTLSNEALKPFFKHPVNEEGLLAAIKDRLTFDTPLNTLKEVLLEQYQHTELNQLQKEHIDALGQKTTFTIVTAHQPNLFTGPLYFIYKILHAIKLADDLQQKWPEYHFVPVYYMGSEDADLDELNHFFIGEEKYIWQTNQVGAVGRMNTKGIASMIESLKGQFGIFPFGNDFVAMLEKAYINQPNIQLATFSLVNDLFASFGLITLIPDHPALKAAFIPVMKRELTEQFSHKLVSATIDKLGENYKVQTAGREINLFYLFDDGRRERIEKTDAGFRVLFSDLLFSESEILQELESHPERFSPNVILRGLFQETILPNIAFIGGGGELAYWLELKSIFEASKVPYPVLVLRNSFLLMEAKMVKLQTKLGLTNESLFLTQLEQEDLLVKHLHGKLPDTLQAQEELFKIYESLQKQAGAIDQTLQPHIAALHAKSVKGLVGLQKKMQRAERKKLQDETRQLEFLRKHLFPRNQLQERIENVISWYAQYGPSFLQSLYDQSLTTSQQFTISKFR